MRRKTHPVVFGKALVVVWAFMSAAHGGEVRLPQPPHAPNPLEGETDVYINDSFEATDAIAKAKRLALSGRWSEAAELLQRTSDSAGDRLVQLAPRYYVSIRDHVNKLMAGWPPAGLAAYRALVEHRMVAAIERTMVQRSLDDLLGLFDRYFCTGAAAKLADIVGQLAMESGNLALATRVYQRVLTEHPDASSYHARYGAVLRVIDAMNGDQAVELTDDEAHAMLRWRGEDRELGEVLVETRRSFAQPRVALASGAWPMMGGDMERNRRSTSSVNELGLLWRYDTSGRPDKASRGAGPTQSFTEERSRPRHLTMHPVASGSLVFVQRYRQIFALHRNTGVVAWRFRIDEPAATGFSDADDQPAALDVVTVHEGRVYASLPGDVVPYYGYQSAQSPPELICLDAQTGGLIWSIDPQSLSRENPETSFDSAPIVRQGRVYLVGRRRRSFGFEDCYLYCFSAASGRRIFRTHVGSASTGTFGSRQATTAVPALHGDTVYVSTNLGSIAAVSAHTGAVRWLRLYPRTVTEESRGSSWSVREIAPWAFNSVIWSDDRVYCLPTDSRHVLVLAADDGRTLREIPIDQFGGVETLLGVHDDLLCGVGTEAACYDIAADSLRWSTALPSGAKLHGRGLWVNESLLVPTKVGLSSFALADGRRTDVAWTATAHGGNLLALPDQLFVADAQSITAYVRKADIWNALRTKMAAAPMDPRPALELAEVSMRSGDLREGIEVLDEAVERADGLLSPLDPTLKRRFFEDAIMFVDMLEAESRLDEDTLNKLFRYASQCPTDATAHVRYRFHFGSLFEKLGAPARALRLYHQILRDRSLRGLPTARDRSARGTGGARLAGAEAQARIAAIISIHGRDMYTPYEAEAMRWLDSAREAHDEAVLARVVATFPNSNAAPLALIAHGDMLLRGARAAEGARQFSRAYHRYPKKVDRPALLRRIADAYEAANQSHLAYRWLSKAMREYPSHLIEHDGRSMTFGEYRDRLAGAGAGVESARPNISPPLHHRFERTQDVDVVLLSPRFRDEPALDWTRYYTHAATGIEAFEGRTGKPLWAKPATTRLEAELLVATSKVAVFATRYEVFALDAATGERRWSQADYPDDLADGAGDWEDGGGFRAHALQGNRLVSVRDDGRMTCTVVPTGKLVWSETHRPIPAGRIRFAESWIAYHVIQDGRVAVCLVDAATGAWVNAIITDETRSVEDIFVTLDGQLILVTSRSIVAYDVETSARRWSVIPGGQVRGPSLLLDLDALYFSDGSRELQKISLEDGRLLWRSEPIVPRGETDLTVERQGGSLIVSTRSSISAIDEVTGLTLWRGTTREWPRLIHRSLSRAYVVIVDLPEDVKDTDGMVYLFDHRNASGMIPSDGALSLGKLADVRTLLVVDGALLIQSGNTIHGWAQE